MRNLSMYFILFLFPISEHLFSQCTNTTKFPSANQIAPIYNYIDTISTTQKPGQYFTIEGLELGETYMFKSSNNGDYISIRDQDGLTLLGSGTSPFNFPVPNGGPDIVTVHINISATNCNSNNVNRVTSVQCTTCENEPSKIGISTAVPKGRLDVNGEVLLGDVTRPPVAGMIRWSVNNQDFEGYDGETWKSFTKLNGTWGHNVTDEVFENRKVVATIQPINSNFGFSVAISGDYAIIGAPTISGGKAFIFKKINGTAWIQQEALNASDGQNGDNFGYSVSISGDYAIIGAPNDNVGGNADQGSAYIFKRTGITWSEEAKITAADGLAGDFFGYDVAIDGSYVIIGAPVDDITNVDQGSAYFFKRTGTSWAQEDKVVANDGAADDQFGFSVSISGNQAIIAANLDDIGGNANQGSAYIFERMGMNWSQEDKLTASDGDINDGFGNSVSISDNMVVIGSPYDNIGANTDQGSVYVFTGTASWVQVAKLIDNNGESNLYFGNSVSIDGTTLVVGEVGKDVGTKNDQGSAYIYKSTPPFGWVKEATLLASDGFVNDQFGKSVAISNNYVVVGAHLQNTGDQGSAYFFNK